MYILILCQVDYNLHLPSLGIQIDILLTGISILTEEQVIFFNIM